MRNDNAYEEIEIKPRKRGDRMLQSETARRRRREAKNVVATRVENKWAKARRQRKRK